jgi:hypothetical protein
MKKLLVLIMVLASFVSYGQEDYKPQITIGGMSGVGFGGLLNTNYGGWVDFGDGGIQYLYGVIVSDNDPYEYINGNRSSYTAGSTYSNFGAYYNSPKFDNTKINLFFGGGVQLSNDITTEGIKKDYSPLAILGASMDLGYYNRYTLRTDFSLSSISSVNIGIGIKL